MEKTEIPEIIVVEQSAERLDKFLASLLTDVSRSCIQEAIEQKAILLNGSPASKSTSLSAGDTIRIDAAFFEPKPLTAEDIPLEILYEDDDVLVLNKQPGIAVHPAAGVKEHTLVNALLHHCTSPEFQTMASESDRPGIVHRLDKDTSGVMLVAKNSRSLAALKQAFQERHIQKWYLALVVGVVSPAKGRIELPIGRNPGDWRRRMVLMDSTGKPAITEYETVASGKMCSMLKIHLLTGRTHQIRVHFSHLGYPVLGDALYGKRVPELEGLAPRQMLHAWRLAFPHPATGEIMRFQAPIPTDIKDAIDELHLKRVIS